MLAAVCWLMDGDDRVRYMQHTYLRCAILSFHSCAHLCLVDAML